MTSVLLTLLVFWGGWMGAVLLWSTLDRARPAESIVVLGAAQYDGHPSPVLRARLDHALELWNRHMARVMILTGGTGPGDTTSEAAVGRSYVRRHGIPEEAILLEGQGRTTRESMMAVAGMLSDHGLKTAILVSDPFHMLRLLILSRRPGSNPLLRHLGGATMLIVVGRLLLVDLSSVETIWRVLLFLVCGAVFLYTGYSMQLSQAGETTQ